VGVSFTHRTETNQSAFRSQLAGLYGIVLTLHHLMARWKPELMSITITCDGELAVDRLNLPKLMKPTEAHYDLLPTVQHICQHLATRN